MLRDLLSSRWFQFGLVFFVLVIGGSLLYSWYTLRTTESDLERHDQLAQGIKQNEARPTETVNVPTQTETPGFVDTPDENTDALVPEPTEALPNEDDDFAEALLPDDFVPEEEAPAEEVAVSPFGFGPYPEVPPDFPATIQVPWNWSEDLRHKFQNHLRDFELMTRVLIKLWNEGDHDFTGGEIHNGLVYPKYPKTVYVRYTEDFEEVADGFVESSSSEIYPGSGISEQDIKIIRDGETPPGIRILNMDTDGINAYKFLNLK